jgi:hypothetical protein
MLNLAQHLKKNCSLGKIDTYQPLHACEYPAFSRSLSLKAPRIGASKLQSLQSMETVLMRVKLRSILKGVQVNIATDA